MLDGTRFLWPGAAVVGSFSEGFRRSHGTMGWVAIAQIVRSSPRACAIFGWLGDLLGFVAVAARCRM